MSISSLFSDNQYDLYCDEFRARIMNVREQLIAKKLNVEELEVLEYIIDNLEVNNAIVNNSVTTPHINSGTSAFNTVDTETMNAGTINVENGTIVNLNSTDANIQNLTVTGTIDIPDLTIDNLNINNNLVVGNDLAVSDAITSASINSTAGTIETINSTTANIGTVNASTSLRTNLVTTRLAGNLVISAPSGNITLNNPTTCNTYTGSTSTLSTSLSAPLVRMNNVNTVPGTGFVVFSAPIQFSAPGLTQIGNQYCGSTFPTIGYSGGSIQSSSTTLILYTRSAQFVSLSFPQLTLTSSGAAGTFIFTLPSVVPITPAPTRGFAGTCLISYLGTKYPLNYRLNSSSLNIFFSQDNENKQFNDPTGPIPVIPIDNTFTIEPFNIVYTQ